ncbi:MAG: LamG-like jellyroll fold domain-containing protein [Eubacteriales bacterium]
MKKIIALLLVVVMASLMFACGGNKGDTTTAPAATTEATKATDATTKATDATTPTPTTPTPTTPTPTTPTPTTPTTAEQPEPGKAVAPYADLDFADGKVTDVLGKVTVELKTSKSDGSPAFVENTEVTFGGVKKTLPAFRTNAKGQYGELTFNEVSSDDFLKFITDNGGLTIEVFYIDKSNTGGVSGIICGTESVGGNGKKGGLAIAQRANRSPYFITANRGNVWITAEKTDYAASKDELIHLVAVLDEDSWELKLYINGTEIASKMTGEAFVTNSDRNEINGEKAMGNMLFLGADPTTTTRADGVDFPSNDLTIVDVKIYNKALTADEVTLVYDAAAALFN